MNSLVYLNRYIVVHKFGQKDKTFTYFEDYIKDLLFNKVRAKSLLS